MFSYFLHWKLITLLVPTEQNPVVVEAESAFQANLSDKFENPIQVLHSTPAYSFLANFFLVVYKIEWQAWLPGMMLGWGFVGSDETTVSDGVVTLEKSNCVSSV